MKIIYNKVIPFKGFSAINLFGVLFVRKNNDGSNPKLSKKLLNHESIHTKQMQEMAFIFFYIWYFIEWLIKLILPPYSNAYRDISFEREAYKYASDLEYLSKRKHYRWIKFIFKKDDIKNKK